MSDSELASFAFASAAITRSGGAVTVMLPVESRNSANAVSKSVNSAMGGGGTCPAPPFVARLSGLRGRLEPTLRPFAASILLLLVAGLMSAIKEELKRKESFMRGADARSHKARCSWRLGQCKTSRRMLSKLCRFLGFARDGRERCACQRSAVQPDLRIAVGAMVAKAGSFAQTVAQDDAYACSDGGVSRTYFPCGATNRGDGLICQECHRCSLSCVAAPTWAGTCRLTAASRAPGSRIEPYVVYNFSTTRRRENASDSSQR